MILNSEQKSAVESNDKRILCLAGAGAGKTRVLIERICRLVREGVPSERIVALTFTNAAAFEMRERFFKEMPAAKIPHFSTFHSFCYTVICENKSARLAIGYAQIPDIADETETKSVKMEACAQLGIKMSEKKLAGRQTLSDKEQADFYLIHKSMLRLMRKKNIITFDYLCNSVCDLFVKNDPSIQGYRDRISYLFADEYQDTDPIQNRFVMSFKDANIFLVADALQAIYSFRGADSSIVKQIAEDDNWTKIRLHKNYRSASNICEYANNFSKYASDSYRIALEATRPEGQVTEVLCEKSYGGFATELPKSTVLSILDNYRRNPVQTAIIARTNAEVDSIAGYLDEYEIRYSMRKRDDTSILQKAVDSEKYAVEWLASFLNADQYYQYIRMQSSEAFVTLDQFLHEFGWNTEVKLHADEIYAARRDESEQPDLNAIIGEETNLYVGTIHSVKGLEYESVHVVGVDSSSFPIVSEENHNLFYVAITRAKDSLYVYREEK